MLTLWLSPIIAAIVATFIARRLRVATHGRFITISGEPIMQIFRGQTITATISAQNPLGQDVPHGPVTFVDPGNGIGFTADDVTATYSVPVSVALGSYPISASFVNSQGTTINVQTTLDVANDPNVAVSGVFVFGQPTP